MLLRRRGFEKRSASFRRARGFTLIELVMTLTVLTILTLGVIPLVKVSVKRQREQRLREALQEMRAAIDEFHRDTVVAMPGTTQAPYIDPRSKVTISDPTIFTVDNPDRYPPDLETLVNGVNVMPRIVVSGASVSTKKKIYLRAIPVDPMTGKAEWELRSSYDAKDANSWGRENVFDVHSKSSATSLNGEKYSDW